MAELSNSTILARTAGVGLPLLFVVVPLYLILQGSPQRPINLDGVLNADHRRMTARETEVNRIMFLIDAEVRRRGGEFALMSADDYRREVEAIYDMRIRAILRASALSWWDLPQQARERAEEDFIRSRHPTFRHLFLFVNSVMRQRP